ncbi:MAG: DUF3298 and DUF4163 domain-containing protein [Lachnospiraceae bacterium]|nr:DUF3298 and DUF4163 domain-containing protein [Lachnospiraceae bacterium]
MRKKYLALLVAVVMVSGMAGCGKMAKEKSESTEIEGSVMEEDSEESTDMERNSEEDDAAQDDAEKEEVSGSPKLQIITHYYDAGEDSSYLYGKYQTAEVIGDNYPELKASVADWFATYETNYKETIEQSLSDAKMQAEEMGDDFYAYSYEYRANTARLDENITSIALGESTYTGGAHGYDYLYGVTFDTRTGKEIQFFDLGDIREEVKSFIDEQIQKKREEGGSFELYEEYIDGLLDNPAWYLDGIGLNVIFNAYEIGSYAEGRTIITIPYEKLTGLQKDYLLAGTTMFAQMEPSIVAAIDVNGDGEAESVEILSEYDENYETTFGVKVNNTSLELGTCSYIINAYYAKCENGRSYVLVSCDAMSDDYVAYLVEVTDGVPKLCEELGVGGVNSISNDGVIVSGNIYVLGTYSGSRAYTFAEGAFLPVDERFALLNDEGEQYRRGPVLKQSLSVQIEESGAMVEKELEAGTKLYPINTDGESVVGFKLEDGTYGEIAFEKKDGTIYIDGVSEYDLFDELPYVG